MYVCFTKQTELEKFLNMEVNNKQSLNNVPHVLVLYAGFF